MDKFDQHAEEEISSITMCFISLLNMDYFSHFVRHVVEFFSMVSPLLSDLSNLLETISWTAENSQNFNKQTVSNRFMYLLS